MSKAYVRRRAGRRLREDRGRQHDRDDEMSQPGRSAPIPARAGIGLRLPHHAALWRTRPAAAWLEVHPENYMADEQAAPPNSSSSARALPALVARRRPVARLGRRSRCRGTSGACAQLVRGFEPGLVSDHLSWSTSGGVYLPDLLPLPYTEEALAHRLPQRRARAGGAGAADPDRKSLDLPALCRDSPMSEADSSPSSRARTGCGVLLDVNNVYVSARNLESILPSCSTAISTCCRRRQWAKSTWPATPGRARRRDTADRRPWLAGVRGRVAPVRARHRRARSGADADRMGHGAAGVPCARGRGCRRTGAPRCAGAAACHPCMICSGA